MCFSKIKWIYFNSRFRQTYGSCSRLDWVVTSRPDLRGYNATYIFIVHQTLKLHKIIRLYFSSLSSIFQSFFTEDSRTHNMHTRVDLGTHLNFTFSSSKHHIQTCIDQPAAITPTKHGNSSRIFTYTLFSPSLTIEIPKSLFSFILPN